MFKKTAFFLVAGFLVLSTAAQERGALIFGDGFDTVATFAENWLPGKGWAGRIKSENGKVVGIGTLQMRRDTPREFYAEVDYTMETPQVEKEKYGQVFGGFMIQGFLFYIRAEGVSMMVWRLPGQEQSRGKYEKIDGFEFGKPVRLTLIRKVDNGNVTYTYRVNGKDSGSFICKESEEAPVLTINGCGGGAAASMDNFAISAIKRSGDDSPNVIVNSGFEYEQEGFPIYYSRERFEFSKANQITYEQYISTWSLDTKEKHSGRQSLKIMADDSGTQLLRAQMAGTVKDLPGIFSVWMKSDRENLPVSISYGGKGKEVMVGTEWKRYEAVNPKLPGVSVISPVAIQVKKDAKGTLWVDDLQAEFLDNVDEADLKSGKIFATPYKPSELDKQKFGKAVAYVRPADIVIPKLLDGVAGKGNLDAWKDKAVKLDKFYFKDKPAKNRTEAYLACDDANLYLGYRCYYNDMSGLNTQKEARDSFCVFGKDSVEFFLDPAADGKFYQFATDTAGTMLDMDANRDKNWNGDWKSAVKIDEKDKYTDYEISMPFSSFSSVSMKSRWLVNICRNDKSAGEFLSIAPTPILSYQNTKCWAYAVLPEDIVAKYSLGITEAAYSDAKDSVSVALKVKNLTGKELTLNAELSDAQNGAGVLGSRQITLKNGENDIAFDSMLKTNKVTLKLAENGKPLAVQTVTLEKSNPVSMLGRLSFYMNEPEAVFKVETNLAESEKLTAVLSVERTVVKKQASASFKIALPLKDIPDGTHTAVLNLQKDGNTVATASAQLIKRPFKEGASQVNHFSRSLIHEGKPIIPIMPFYVFGHYNTDAYVLGYLDWLEKNGFKFAHILVEERGADKSALFLKAAHEKGIRVMLWTKYYIMPDGKLKFMRPDGEPAWDAFQKKMDFPCVISQLVIDEPELAFPSKDVKDFLDQMRARFPYQPTQMNNGTPGIPSGYAELNTDILMLDDYLTNNENRTVESVVSNTDIMWEKGRETGKPCMFFVVCNNFPLHYREPSYAEQIAQCYGNIAAGCRGLSLYWGCPATEGNLKASLQVNREILSLTDVLTSEEEISQSTSSANPKLLRNLTKKHQGYVYLITCNIDANPKDGVTFTLPAELQYTGDVEVLFENRKVNFKNGRFTDDFAGHSRHVYKIKLK